MTKKIRVLITAPSLDSNKNVSGVSTVARNIIDVLRDKVSMEHLEVGAEQTGLGLHRKINSAKKILLSIGRILLEDFDVLHSNTALNPKSILRDAALILAAKARGRAVVLHLHGGKYVYEKAPPLYTAIIDIILKAADEIVVLSHLERKIISERSESLRSKIAVIYNGIAMNTSTRAPRKTPGVNVVFAGRLVEEKGVKVLLEASKAFEADVALAVFGAGPLSDEVAMATAANCVSFEGVFASSEAQQILSRYDALILPSLNGEGMPMAIIEAMAAGVVPICTPISSVPEVVSHFKTGVLVETGNADAISEAVNTLAGKPDVLRDLSQAAKAFAVENFDATRNFAELEPIYERILR